MIKTAREELVALFPIAREDCEIESWHCTTGTQCVNRSRGSSNGVWLGWSCEGMFSQPFIAVMRDGSAWMMCEDCVSILQHEKEARIEESYSIHERCDDHHCGCNSGSDED